MGTGTQRGGSPPKTIVDDGDRHTVLLTILESNAEAKIYWRSLDGDQTTTEGAQVFVANFGAMVAGVLWLWVNRDPVKCLLAMMLTLAGWLAAVNTANDVINTIQGSSLFGTIEGAKVYREMLGWLVGGLLAGAVGGGLTAFGSGIAATAIRRPEAWMPIVVVGAIAGLLLYPAALLDAIILLFVPWQAAVAAAIAFGLTWQNDVRN